MTHCIALIHKEIEKGFGVSFPDVPGVIAVADTLDQALYGASAALGFAFEDWGGGKPSPRSLDDLHADPDFRRLATDAIVAAIEPASPVLRSA